MRKLLIHSGQLRQQGFTLLELTLVLVTVGVLLVGAIQALRSAYDSVRFYTTQQKMDNISRVLASFVQNNYYLPCPADSTANPVTGLAISACATNALGTGIVPYETLGLSQEQVRDSFGNFITYAVSPGFAGTAVQASDNIQSYCRSRFNWVTPTNLLGTTGFNKNPRKARFCCSSLIIASDLEVYRRTGELVSPVRTSSAANMDTPATVTSALSPAVAFVLISHGRNGIGAFTGNVTTPRVTGSSTGRANEAMNDDSDRTFASQPLNRNTTNADGYFDDIVLWRTQTQLLSIDNRDSCARP